MPVKRSRTMLLIAAIIVALPIVVAFLPDRQPRYQGRTLAAWVDDMQESFPGAQQWLAGSNAVYNIGTNAIPILMRWNASKNSKMKSALISKWNARVEYEWRIRTSEERKMMAWFGFGALGEKSRPAWPVFIQWTQDKDMDTRIAGITMLRGCRADKAVFVPVAQRLLKDTEVPVQAMAARYFSDLYPEEAEAAGVYKQFPGFKVQPGPAANTNTPAPK